MGAVFLQKFSLYSGRPKLPPDSARLCNTQNYMPGCFLSVRQVIALAFLFAVSNARVGAQGDGVSPGPSPTAETLHYDVEWRLITAGKAELHIEPERDSNRNGWEAKVHLESAGLVSRLYKLDDHYSVALEKQFCAVSSSLDAFEGKKHHDTKVTYDSQKGHATYVERDVFKNTTVSKETPIPSCVSDVIGGLYKLRTMHVEPGQSITIPTSDGKKTAQVRIEAQEREQISTGLGSFKTIRYEAFLFNGVIYARKASMLVWLTDDARRLPVRIRARMSFPIGSITLDLEKIEHS